MTISTKLRHETFLDFELRKLSQGHRLTDDTYNEYVAETNKKAVLDSQGRHRSEWIYSEYDGRKASTEQEAWDVMLERFNGRKT